MANVSAPPALGILEIGVRVSDVLFGIMSLQTYIYFRDYPRDNWRIKCLVIFVWICGLGQTVFSWWATYTMTVLDFGVVKKPPRVLYIAVIFHIPVGPVVQSFFAHRVYRISRKTLIPIICWILSVLRFMISILLISRAFLINLHQLQLQFRWVIATGFIIGLGVDITVTASVCYYLRRERAYSFNRTSRLLDKLIKWTIQNGMLTSITGVASLICIIFFNVDSTLYIVLHLVLAKLFGHALLVTLNARVRIRNITESTVPSAISSESKFCGAPAIESTNPAVLEMIHTIDDITRITGDSTQLIQSVSQRPESQSIQFPSLSKAPRDQNEVMKVVQGYMAGGSIVTLYFARCILLVIWCLPQLGTLKRKIIIPILRS